MDRLSAVLAELRAAVRGALEEIDHPSMRPADLARRLGLDAALAWSVSRIATATSPFAAGLHVPGEKAFSRFVEGARVAGVSDERVERIRRSHEAFERLKRAEGGIRRGLKTMLADLADAESPADDLRSKRDAFRANSHLYGLQVRAAGDCKVIHPAGGGERFDVLVVRSIIDIRQLRRSASCSVRFRAHAGRDAATGRVNASTPEPVILCDEDEAIGGGLLTQYCSRPLPEVSWCRHTPGLQVARASHRSLGVAGAATVTTGLLARSTIAAGAFERGYGFSTSVRSPTELAYVDLLVPRDWLGSLRAELRVYGRASGEIGSYAYDDEDLLAVQESLETHPQAVEVLEATGESDYTRAIAASVERVGWDLGLFAIVRARMQCPVLNALARIELTRTPGGSAGA